VFLDRFIKNKHKKRVSKEIIGLASRFQIYEPRIFIIELLSVSARKTSEVEPFVSEIEKQHIHLRC